MNNWAPPWYPIPQHEYSGSGGVSWECWEPPLYPVVDHTRAESHLSIPLCFHRCTLGHVTIAGIIWGMVTMDLIAWLSITALYRGWIDWLHRCGFVWVFNWLINCGLGLRCDWLWVVSSGLELGRQSPQVESWAPLCSCNMLVLFIHKSHFLWCLVQPHFVLAPATSPELLSCLVSTPICLCSHVALPGALYVLFCPGECSIMSGPWHSADTTKTSLQTSKTYLSKSPREEIETAQT